MKIVRDLNGHAPAPTPTFQPLHDNVLVRPIEASDQTKGGLIVDPRKMEASADFRRALVIAVGPGGFLESGQRIALDVQPGDTVLYAHPGSASLDHVPGEKTNLRIVPYRAIACIERAEVLA